MKVVDKTDHLSPGEIGMINLGDTRHIATINAYAEGCTPEIAMQLAGHEDITTNAHYATNLKKYIKCRTYRKYRQVIGGDVKYNLQKVVYGTSQTKGKRLSDGNLCFSQEYAFGSINDCLKTTGPDGQLAFCPNCRYYRLDGQSYTDEKYTQKIDQNYELYAEAVELVRKNKGCEETLMVAMNKLKASCLSLAQYYEETKGEDIWEEKGQ